MDDKIADKIAKLLALSESPNENEAKAALLKARALMAKYKLRPEQIQQKDKTEVVELHTGITCTKTLNTWATVLAPVIAKNYCCRSFRIHTKRKKKVEVGFLGLKEDVEICAGIFRYAYNCVLSECKSIRKKYADNFLPSTTRDMANSYGLGFVAGLQDAFEEQSAQKTAEWGLVMVTPQVVQEAAAKIGKPSTYCRNIYGSLANEFKRRGYDDGKQFNPARDLKEGTHELPPPTPSNKDAT